MSPRKALRLKNGRATAAPTKPSFLSTQVTDVRRYFLNLRPRPGRNLEVVCGGVERCLGDYVIERAGFPFLAIEFIAEGQGRLQLRDREFQLRPGMAFAYGPGVRHVIRNQPRSPMLKYYVDFVGRAGEKLLQASPLSGGDAVQVSALADIIQILEHLQRSATAQSRCSAAICAHLVAVLILKITETVIPFGAQETRAFPTYQRVRQHLEEHYLELKTVEEVAGACHVNVCYLCRLFQRFHHQSPYQYLMRLKMNQAARLLLDTGLQIKEVATDLHFGDPYTFSRAFKTVFGLSPEAFVKRGQRWGQG